MTRKTGAEVLIDFSNDNPYFESQFKTTKYGPWYPERFASVDEARA